MEDNGPWLDSFHEKHPNICLGVSEYGCEGIITYHGPEPKCKDYSEDYQAMYHEHMAKVLDERPWIWSSHVWNMFDFGCAARDEGGVAGRNNKGLMTMDRKTKKDSYYIYKAYWNPEPMVHLCGKRYAQRAGEEREIKVYTNQDSVTLYMNGEEVGTQAPVDHIARFTVAMKDGENIFLAVAGKCKDTMTIEKVEVEPEIYTLPGQDEGDGGAANWFVAEGDVDLEDDAPMEFPEGKLSIKSTIGQIYKNEAAWEFFSKMTQGKVGPDMPMWGMMENFAVEMMLGMAGNLPESAIKALNKQLTQFDAVE
jgi:beta-galactosidase